MRKRSLKLLVLLAVICAAASSFVSCKDNHSDDMASVHSELATLGDVVKQQEQILSQLSKDLENAKSSLSIEINSLKIEIDNLKTQIANIDFDRINELYVRVAKLEAEYTEINTSIGLINETLQKYGNDISDLGAKYLALNGTMSEVLGRLKIVEDNVQGLSNKIDGVSDDLGKKIDELGKVVENYNAKLSDRIDSLANLMPKIDSKFDALQDSVNKINGIAQLALDYAEACKAAMEELEQKFGIYYSKEEIDSMIAATNSKAGDAQTAANEAKQLAQSVNGLATEALGKATDALDKANQASQLAGSFDGRITELEDALANVKDYDTEIADLYTQLNTLKTDLIKLSEELGILQGAVDNLKNDIAKMIVGVTYQGIENPVIGQFSLPVGLENNMLFAWFGKNTGGDQPKWPNNHLEVSDLQMIGEHETFGIEAGDVFVTDMGNQKAYLGRVYTTINPNTVDFAGQSLKIVDSQDAECSAYLEPLKNSNELLQFGFTRGANNGFYEADAWIDYDKVEDIRITKNIDKEQLASALKTTLSGLKAELKGNSSGLGLTTLYKTFMENVSCIVPQYGLKASWFDSDSLEHSVYSKYGLAVTSIKPASFDFLKDFKTPKIPLISEIKFDVEFKLDSVHYDPITAPDMKLTLYIVFNDIVIEEKDINQKTVVGVFSNRSDAEACVASNPGSYIEEKVFTVPEFQEFVDEINNGLIRKVNRDVNKLIEQITGQTQKNVNKALGQVNNGVIGRVNKIIRKLNDRLADLNHYLQPIALYSSDRLDKQKADGSYVTEWFPLSNNWLVPSPVNCEAEGGYVQIEPTTITAESVCPCYRKFVAVTDVFKANYSTSAKAGDAGCKAALDEANKPAPDAFNKLGVHSMKTVYSDNQDLVFAVKPGYVYEISYIALDYSGKTRVHKYYIKARNY